MTDKEKIKQAIKLREESAHLFAASVDKLLRDDAAASKLLQEALEENVEPPKKQIDWSKMPEVLVEVSHNGDDWYKRYFAGINDEGDFTVYINGATGKTTQSKLERERIRLIEQPTLTFWKGGECPIPDGVRFEVYHRDGDTGVIKGNASEFKWSHKGSHDDIIGYRILGPAEGWE